MLLSAKRQEMLARIKRKFQSLKSGGQGLVEFALVIPILLTMIFGIFEAGRAMWIYSAVTSASREAARYGSSVSDNSGGTPIYLDCVGIRDAAKRIGAVGGVEDGDIVITYDNGPGTASIGSCPVDEDDIVLGDRVIVQVTGYFNPAPAIPLFDFPTFNINSVTRRTILKEIPLPFITPAPTPTP